MGVRTRNIIISMRMSVVRQTGELRNALAQDWTEFMAQIMPDAFWIPVPNMGVRVTEWLSRIPVEGVILSGGDDWGTFPVRDETEFELCRFSRENEVPLLGVCRGMQVLNYFLGGDLPAVRDKAHVTRRHVVTGNSHGRFFSREVNSYHSGLLTERNIASGLSVEAQAADGSVEAVRAIDGPFYGVMWHPEREKEIDPLDRALFNDIFGDG